MGRSIATAAQAGFPLLVLLLAAGCGDDGPVDNQNTNQNPCLDGYQADGPACVPLFDDPADCPAPNEMPALGGGCRTVGVTQCATGFGSDGEGGCEPLLPAEPCPPGTMERIGQTECQSVGVTQCAEGFVPDGTGGCDALLPPGECPPGTIEVIGHETCQPLGDCGPEGSPWGLIAVDGTTVYVDASADATGASGSASAPFPTIAAALAVVESGGQVALAAGTYEEGLVLDRPVRLEGRCAARVTLRGIAAGPALRLTAGGTGSEVRGVTLTGPGPGLQVEGGQEVVIETVEVRDTGGAGVRLQDGASATLHRVKVAGATTLGLRSENSTLHAVQTVTRGTRASPDTGGFGTGVQATCTDPARCGSLLLEGSLVTANRHIGLVAIGVEATVRSTVIRDTLPQQSDLTRGIGIAAVCDPGTGVCGRLTVEGSLVLRNRRLGISATGVETVIRTSVVRDTQSQESERIVGTGIEVSCDLDVGSCGSLLLEESLVAGNRQSGIYTLGVDATLRSSLVRDTLPHELDQGMGTGITADCVPDPGVCGSLLVDGCLVTGNRDAAVRARGVPTTLRASTLSDTLPQESDLDYGRGIESACYEGFCGDLLVDGCLVDRNRDLGVVTYGTRATVRATVVRDTRANPLTRLIGRGIESLCHEGSCGSLLVDGCLVTGNQGAGIRTTGPEATIRATVVRDTLPQEGDRRHGWGIEGWCKTGACGSLLVDGCLVTGNRQLGVLASGVAATVRDSIVRDTLPRETDLGYGDGIAGWCDLAAAGCGSLLVDGCLVTGNREAGIITFGVTTTVRASVVVDTQPRESDQQFGRGINAQCQADTCGSLSVEETLVSRNVNGGIYLEGIPAILRGVAVIETALNAAGQRVGEWGQGLWVRCEHGGCGLLEAIHCRVASSHGVGVGLEGVSGSLTGSVVDGVLARPQDGGFGYGIQIAGLEGEALPTFDVRQCVVRDAELAGVLYHRAQGTLSGSVVSGGDYCVAMNEGSAPTVPDDNQLACTVESEPAWVSLDPSPAPPPAVPVLSLEE